MGLEIERKFLVTGTPWKAVPGVRICQGYLCRDPARTVRVRLKGTQAFLTIKGAANGPARAEFEYEIPRPDAEALLVLCDGPIIDKSRHCLTYGAYTWEIDEFYGDNAGLVLAEVELPDAAADVPLPPWIGREVTGDPRYYNARLSCTPYRCWADLA